MPSAKVCKEKVTQVFHDRITNYKLRSSSKFQVLQLWVTGSLLNLLRGLVQNETSELCATCPHVGSESGKRKFMVLTRTLMKQKWCQPCSVAVRICIILDSREIINKYIPFTQSNKTPEQKKTGQYILRFFFPWYDIPFWLLHCPLSKPQLLVGGSYFQWVHSQRAPFTLFCWRKILALAKQVWK